ncbi:MAG TPA: helicase C-terminal domain-containing protein [Acidobacteriaceae bacterium]|jgi:hypothetical protein|nr:helicase C-terminal domain-containing protein [Acidobacteriaceae bacterium]
MAPPLDFSQLGSKASAQKVIDPRKLFTTLQRDPRFRRPSDEQGDVLDAWFATRSVKDHTVKMNTGSGKTLVGLLILQSSLNEGIGPAVYITPDNYLSAQVISEAKDLGIAVTENEKSAEFRSHKAILVANIHKLFNGRSVFGVGTTKIKIGSLVIDDAHACLAIVASQFSIRLSGAHPIYSELLGLFKDDLMQQSPAGGIQVVSGDPQGHMAVPFWAWQGKLQRVLELMLKNKDDEELIFTLPLLQNQLSLCQCYFGGGNVEISPRCIPTEVIPAFHKADRRVYMTATLADDGVLITQFGAESESVETPIRPKGVGTMGDRMILMPQEISPRSTEEDVRALVCDVAKTHNVAVIVPSARRLPFWQQFAAQVLDAKNIHEGVAKLKQGKHIGLTVLLNKYDGVDLPDDACRVLVIDGLPEVYSLADRTEFAALDGTELQLVRQVQRIEQGMGRGVRSSEDYCVVLLTGARLTARLADPRARRLFTPATQAQLALGDKVAEQVKGKPLSEMRGIMNYCLTQDKDWVNASRAELAQAPDGPPSFVNPTVRDLRKAFDFGLVGLWGKAKEAAQAAVNKASEDATKGYLMQQLAEYTYHVSQPEAQEILLSAIQLNPRITRPLGGVTYSKLATAVVDQGTQAVSFMSRFKTSNELMIWINGLLEDLIWSEDESQSFERAIQNLGLFLGFGSQMPEADTGKGPDNLWALGELKYLVIECKSGSQSPVIGKKDCDQLTGSMTWFAGTYDATCSAIPLMIHPSSMFDKYSSVSPGARVMDTEKLGEMKAEIRKYAVAVSHGTVRTDVVSISKLIKTHDFNGGMFAHVYAKSAKIGK